MIFRYFHERVAWKPYRPWVARASQCGWAAIGVVGFALRELWQRLHPSALEPLRVDAARHIIVIRPDRIGDAVLSTPALRALRQAAPHARITVIASATIAPFVKSLSSVDETVVVGGDRLVNFWVARQRLLALRVPAADLIVVLQSAWPAGLLSWWLKGRHRLGYDLFGMGWLFTIAVPYPFLKRKVHQVESNLHLLRQAGIATPPAETVKLEVPITETGYAAAQQWLKAHEVDEAKPLAVIHPGSRSRYTQWAPRRFGMVADQLMERGVYQIVVLCGPNEEAIVRQMVAGMKNKPLMASGLPLDTVTALLARCALFIGNATGTMHLASAVSRRVIAVIGGTHPHDCPERWGPWGKNHRVVHKTPEETIGRSTWDWVGPEGLRYIMPEDVLKEVRTP